MEHWRANDFTVLVEWGLAGFPNPFFDPTGSKTFWIYSPNPGKEM